MARIIEILYKSMNLAILWSVCVETEEFSWRKGSGRSINLFPEYKGLKAHADVWSRATGLTLGLSLHLLRYSVSRRSGGYGETEHMSRCI